MLLIECSADNSLLILEENYAICDAATVKSGDVVKFFYKKKHYEGEVLMRSDDKQKLKCEMKKIQASINRRKTPEKPSPNVLTSSSKRLRKKPRSYSPSNNLENKQKKAKMDPAPKKMVNPKSTCDRKYSSESDLSTEDEIEDFKENHQEATHSYTADNSSPTQSLSNSPPKNLSDSPVKNVIRTTPSRQSDNSTITNFDETLKRKSPQKRLPRQILKHHSENDESDDDEFDNLDDDEQLFGPNFVGNSMVHLHKHIFCQKRILQYALSNSSQATHIARKLLEGVFKKEALLKCTLTGQPGRAQMKERQQEVVPMHRQAKNAIIQYSKKIAEKRKWTVNSTADIKKSMSQRLVEIKSQERKNRA